MSTVDPVQAAVEDCDTCVAEGADAAELAACREEADMALINAVGSDWVLSAAGAPANSDKEAAWETYGVPWCRAYSGAYRAHAVALAAEVQS